MDFFYVCIQVHFVILIENPYNNNNNKVNRQNFLVDIAVLRVLNSNAHITQDRNNTDLIFFFK